MNQTIFSKSGRLLPEVAKKTTMQFMSYDGTSETKLLPSTQRPCRSNKSTASVLEDWTNWNNTKRAHKKKNKYKPDTSTGNSQDQISQPATQRETQPTLPLIRKGVARAVGTKPRTVYKNTEVTHLKTLEKGGKLNVPTISNDMTPWVKASPSETSLTALMKTIPSPQNYLVNMADQSQRAQKNDVSWGIQVSEQQLPKDKAHNRAKHRGRTGISKRRTVNKFHSIKLPPVPAVTELSFSRNFSFSFFELPQHQTPQHWLQRQRSVYVLMKQLQ